MTDRGHLVNNRWPTIILVGAAVVALIINIVLTETAATAHDVGAVIPAIALVAVWVWLIHSRVVRVDDE